MCLYSVTSLHPRDNTGCLGGREFPPFHRSGEVEAQPERLDPGCRSRKWRCWVSVAAVLGPDAVPSVHTVVILSHF